VEPVFLVGPTAVGKSAVAIELARLLHGEILSADSMQVYRGMDIGTAKPTGEERRAIPHHLIDVCDVDELFDVKRYVTLARALIARLQSPLIICGGTGLYVRALRRGLFDGPSRNPKLRARLEKMSASELFAELQKLDPLTASRIDRRNPRRLVRALEVFYETGKPISVLQAQWSTPHLNPLPPTTGERRFPSPRLRGEGQGEGFCFCLTRDRDDLYERIERRIDAQIAAGWVDETRRLMARGLEKNPTAMQAAGYRELVAHVRGELSLDQAVALIRTRTRQLAKRQLTWFRREPGLEWIQISGDESARNTASRIKRLL
jgi:tRNA dimethylallyltransferase